MLKYPNIDERKAHSSRKEDRILTIVSLMIIVVLSISTGSVFRQHKGDNHLISCLAMLVAMTKSTLIGLIVAIWIPDMVIAAILSIVVSFVLVLFMINGLSVRVFVDSIGALFMGAMMGAMLSIMSSDYELVGLAFFGFVYIFSSVLASGLLNKKRHSTFLKAIPFKAIIVTSMASLLLIASFITDSQFESEENKIDQEIEHNHK